MTGHLVPCVSDTYNLGTATTALWNNGYALYWHAGNAFVHSFTGTAAAPAYTFDTGTRQDGMYLIAAGNLGFSALGEKGLSILNNATVSVPHIAIGSATAGNSNLFYAAETLHAGTGSGDSRVNFRLDVTASNASTYGSVTAANLNPTLDGSATISNLYGSQINATMSGGTIAASGLMTGQHIAMIVNGGTFSGAAVCGVRVIAPVIEDTVVPYVTGGYFREGGTLGGGLITTNAGLLVHGVLRMQSNTNNEIMWGAGSTDFKTTYDTAITRSGTNTLQITQATGTGSFGNLGVDTINCGTIKPRANNTYDIGSTTLNFNRLYMAAGTAAAPSYTFGVDTGQNTGMFRAAEDALGFTAGGVEALRLTETATAITARIGTTTATAATLSFISTASSFLIQPEADGVGAGADLTIAGQASVSAVQGARVIIGGGKAGATGGDLFLRGGDSTTDGFVYIGDVGTRGINCGTATDSATIGDWVTGTLNARRMFFDESAGRLIMYDASNARQLLADAATGYLLVGTCVDAGSAGDFNVGLTGAARLFYDQSVASLLLYNAAATQTYTINAEQVHTVTPLESTLATLASMGATTFYAVATSDTSVRIEVIITGIVTDGTGSLTESFVITARNDSGTLTQTNSVTDGPVTDGVMVAPTITFSISGTNVQVNITNNALKTARFRVKGYVYDM